MQEPPLGAPLGEATRINEACRKSGGRFILADTYGLFGGLFCDFGAAPLRTPAAEGVNRRAVNGRAVNRRRV